MVTHNGITKRLVWPADNWDSMTLKVREKKNNFLGEIFFKKNVYNYVFCSQMLQAWLYQEGKVQCFSLESSVVAESLPSSTAPLWWRDLQSFLPVSYIALMQG